MSLRAPRIGLDLVAVGRMRNALEGKRERWQRRVFTAHEWRGAEESSDPAAALALCFAVKEATFKVLGSGWGRGVAWQDVEALSGEHADPVLRLAGRAAELAAEAGLTLTASTAVAGERAVAMVLGQ